MTDLTESEKKMKEVYDRLGNNPNGLTELEINVQEVREQLELYELMYAEEGRKVIVDYSACYNGWDLNIYEKITEADGTEKKGRLI